MTAQNAVNLLRVVTQRLSSTPVKQLPHVAPYLATTIAQHGKALASPAREGQVSGDPEAAIIVHKLKTQLSALLQDKHPEARYAAVILIKATVEVGGWNILQGIGAWIRGLIGILGRPDSPSTKKLCTITVTRIFLLTHEHQSLVREITTPSLPGFIAVCLDLAKSSVSSGTTPEKYSQGLLLVVLQALSELIAMHPTSFRPFVPQILSLTHPLLAPTPSNFGLGNDSSPTSATVSERARHLFVSLHVCGPKNTAGEEWARSLDTLMISVQRTADKLFRSLIENTTSLKGNYDVANSDFGADVVSDQAPAPLGLPAWTGINAGIERLEGLLQTLQAFLATATSAAVTLPVGNILSLIDRILSVVPPGNGRSPRIRPEVSRDEREGLWVGLPRLQTSVLGVCSLLISRMGHSSAAVAYTVMEQLLWTFGSQYGNDEFRNATYRLLSQILSTFGPPLPKTYMTSLSRCIRMCCEDLLPSIEDQSQGGQASASDASNTRNGVRSSMNADSYLIPATHKIDLPAFSTSIQQAARELLPLALTSVPSDYLPFSLRCQIDRTAIITQDKKAMLASVLNPIAKRNNQTQTSSILPLLANAYPNAMEIEALLRPQMPPIQSRRNDPRDTETAKEEDAYMHDYPENGEFYGFNNIPEETTGNATVKEKATLKPSNGQLGATLGTVEANPSSRESPSGFKPPATSLLEPHPASSQPPQKRDREEDSCSNNNEQNAIERDGLDASETLETARKRSRIGHDGTGRESPEGPPVPAGWTTSVVDASGTREEAVSEHAVGQVLKQESAIDQQQQQQQSQVMLGGSDESDFEMPVLDLGSESGEEDEEDEDEEEDYDEGEE